MMWCCLRTLAGLVAVLEILIFFGVVGAHVFFCLQGFGFKGHNLTCEEYVFLSWPLLIFLAAIDWWAIVVLLKSSSKKTTITSPASQLRRVNIYRFVTIPIMLLELFMALYILGSSEWYSLFVMIMLFGLAGKNMIFLGLVAPLHSKLYKRLHPPPENETPKAVKVVKKKAKKFVPPVLHTKPAVIAPECK